MSRITMRRASRAGTAALLAAAVLCAVSVSAASAAPAQSGGGPALSGGIASAVLGRINAVRRAHGLRALRPSTALGRAALAHARSMARLGYFSHNSPDGTSPASRVRRFYGGSAVGETMLWASPSVSASQALSWWVHSPEHRRILLFRTFRDVGLAAVHVDSAPGTYGGRPVTILVADFGAR